MISDARKAELLSAAEFLLKARSTANPVDDLSAPMTATSLEEAYFMQDAMAHSLQPEGIVDWKVGAPAPDATPIFGPMIRAWVGTDGCTVQRQALPAARARSGDFFQNRQGSAAARDPIHARRNRRRD